MRNFLAWDAPLIREVWGQWIIHKREKSWENRRESEPYSADFTDTLNQINLDVCLKFSIVKTSNFSCCLSQLDFLLLTTKKHSKTYTQFSSYSFFRAMSCRILVPQPGIKAVLPAVEKQSLNHWTAREVCILNCSMQDLQSSLQQSGSLVVACGI